QLHDRAIKHYRQAIELLKGQDYSAAQTQIQAAITLNRNPDFYALAGQLYALQGQFRQAIAAWNYAQFLDPNHSAARNYSRLFAELFAAQKQSSSAIDGFE
ncbi:MAG: hypothetical protein F6K28_60830, partial [Microcoleus sp. SIO2G3]|nr:hypothetical protein [Microcoleus sp. SIO2G3]